MKLSDMVETADNVIRFIEAHREQAINRLFPASAHSEGYRQQWRDRTIAEFWLYLDSRNQHELVMMATDYYNDKAPAIIHRVYGE